MSAPQSPSLALAALLLLGGVPATAQSLASEVQALANDLAVEGYSRFTLETPVLQDPVLVAVKEDIVLELTLDPATLDITDVVVAVDDDGDGRLSNRERRGATPTCKSWTRCGLARRCAKRWNAIWRASMTHAPSISRRASIATRWAITSAAACLMN